MDRHDLLALSRPRVGDNARFPRTHLGTDFRAVFCARNDAIKFSNGGKNDRSARLQGNDSSRCVIALHAEIYEVEMLNGAEWTPAIIYPLRRDMT